MSAQRVDLSNVMNSVIQKKLDDKILELIDLAAKNQYDENLENYIKIAKKNNFKSELEMLYEIGCDLALEFLKTNKEKKTAEQLREQKERNLEDYLVNPVNLAKIEKGLKFEERQAELDSGRIDIRAKDQNNKTVYIELKTGYDSPKDLFLQIGKYLGASKENDRIFFVAPEIKPEVYYGLKQIDIDNKLSIFLVNENKENYEFKIIGDEHFANQPVKNIQWDKVAKVRKEKMEKEKKSTIVKIKGNKNYLKNIMDMNKDDKDNKDDNTPEYLREEEKQKLPDWFNKFTSDYLVKLASGDMEVNQKDVLASEKKSLKKLILPHKLKSVLREHESHYKWFIHSKELNELVLEYGLLNKKTNNDNKGLLALCLAEEIFERYRPGFIDAMKKFSGEIMNIDAKFKGDVDEIITNLEKHYKENEKILQEIKKDKELNKIALGIKSLKNSNSELEDKIVNAYAYNLSFVDARMSNEFMKIKIVRTKKLASICKELALAYLFWNFVDESLESVGEEKKGKDNMVYITPNSLHNLIAIDSHHYASLLNFLKSDREEAGVDILEGLDLKVLVPNGSDFLELKGYVKNIYEIFEDNNLERENIKNEQDNNYVVVNLKEEKYLDIINAVYHTENGFKNCMFTNDMKKRVEYFAEDVVGLSLPEERIKLLTDSLKSFKLMRRFRHREDCCNEKELPFRNFFDDIMVNYVRKDKMPGTDDLEKLYKNNFNNSN
ncbi:MAG: DUF91 domain-containing protein [Nanoarchaeota archaeon]|nr:DUF91 domain-containing protein [Nanoarchaeota archaeon]MBU1269112.1 DUF91 domain-containing protein [Nanoarchaeota archaeon]MBU1604909.1 DUF91 domain-containing protein [Nanoarchaeota archaeon]MBU2443118.1 DUF91 domain-containing protein [Nanoarchaeota archaeon]